MDIRKATENDLPRLMEIFEGAKQFMRSYGNMTQWNDGYPTAEVLRSDIANDYLYIVGRGMDEIAGVFALIPGADPTYSHIEGRWHDKGAYATIHRLAAVTGARGVADAALQFALESHTQIRIDTHKDNTPMLNWIRSRGFIHCGTIIIADGTSREAFSLSRSK